MHLALEVGKQVYFAYGSNMDFEQMKTRCPNAILLGKAKLFGYSFELDSEGCATIAESASSYVHGIAWLIDSGDEESLDRYEGVSSGCYSKEKCKIVLDDDQIEALAYISQRPTWEGRSRDGGAYIERIIAAAKSFNLPAEYIKSITNLGF